MDGNDSRELERQYYSVSDAVSYELYVRSAADSPRLTWTKGR